MNDLEIDRAKEEAQVDEILSISDIAEKLRQKGNGSPRFVDIIIYTLNDYAVTALKVPANFPLQLADQLRQSGIEVTPQKDPFWQSRNYKTEEEINAIEIPIRHTENAIDKAVQVLKASDIKGDFLFFEGEQLTSEKLRQVINMELLKNNCICTQTIVASGNQCADPHNRGSGPLYANSTIIMDVFPRSLETNYHADITRTVVRGKASDEVKKMFDAVEDAQGMGCEMVKEGIKGSAIHNAIHDLFEDRGFESGLIDGRMQGFFHGTGHGLGLDVHEEPRVSISDNILKAGEVVTIEPGLYYAGIGGIRIEDDVLVTKTGHRNLVQYPKFLEV